MTPFAITGAAVLTAEGWQEQHAVVVAHRRISGVVPDTLVPNELRRHDLAGGALLPGFVDVQVNGGGGVLFNDRPNVEGIAAIASAHRRFGTTAFLPTLISDELDVVADAIAAVDAAVERGICGVAGIHIEGPFLNESKRGIHDAGKFRMLDVKAVELLSSLRNGVTLVTLAPELVEPGLIRALVSRGVIVAAGHSAADYETMQLAVGEGLTGVTHLFNAMSPMTSRAPGVVGAALDLDLMSGMIVDGQHAHPASLRVALAAAGPDRLMLVTDAMPTVGSAVKQFELGGHVITAEGGACRSADGTLAGSDLDMASAVRNAMAMMNIDLAVASRMASTTPARFLGMQATLGTIAPGMRADLVHLDDAHEVTEVWIGGVQIDA